MFSVIISGGILLLQARIPLPPSHNAKKPGIKRKPFREAVHRVLCGYKGRLHPDASYALEGICYAKWRDANGNRIRRDVPNLLKYLSDDVAKVLEVDDKCFDTVALVGRDVPASASAYDEYVLLRIWKG